ncbi:MAG: hypothetical protein WDM77_12885 [Steroidobacteraceae bacterium]
MRGAGFRPGVQFHRYTQVSGLRNLGVEQLLVDRKGDLWLATDGGLYRYDGTSFNSYDKSRGIPADAAMAVAASPSGRISHASMRVCIPAMRIASRRF